MILTDTRDAKKKKRNFSHIFLMNVTRNSLTNRSTSQYRRICYFYHATKRCVLAAANAQIWYVMIPFYHRSELPLNYQTICYLALLELLQRVERDNFEANLFLRM